MAVPVPKVKNNPTLSPEFKRAFVQPNQVNSVAADVPTLVADFNALLVKLRNAGIIDG